METHELKSISSELNLDFHANPLKGLLTGYEIAIHEIQIPITLNIVKGKIVDYHNRSSTWTVGKGAKVIFKHTVNDTRVNTTDKRALRFEPNILSGAELDLVYDAYCAAVDRLQLTWETALQGW